MNRSIAPFAAILALAALSLPAVAQQKTPAAPEPKGAPVFPPVSASDFTAAQPRKEVVNAFLKASWGFDESRVWQVQAILKTTVEGVSKVIVLVGDKSGAQKPSVLSFYAMADGKHIIAGDSILPFGERPFAEARALLQERANGPYTGAASKDLEIVEFSDFQCPHCKDAQANMDKLAADFPKARIVFQNYPLKEIHPSAELAAKYAICAAKLGGSVSYLTFASAVYEGQSGLYEPDGATLTLNSAAVKAGLEPQKVAACSASPETAEALAASVKLAGDLEINQTPTLMINGRPILANTSYETLKKVVAFQAKLDGVAQ